MINKSCRALMLVLFLASVTRIGANCGNTQTERTPFETYEAPSHPPAVIILDMVVLSQKFYTGKYFGWTAILVKTWMLKTQGKVIQPGTNPVTDVGPSSISQHSWKSEIPRIGTK